MLILGDAIEYMAQHKDISDCIVCDPPYKLTSGGKNTGEMGGCFSTEIYNNDGSIVDCDIDWPDFMPMIYDSLKHGHAYIMSNNRNVQAMLNAAEQAGFGFHNLLVWDKVTATPNRWYMKNCEFTGFFYKGKAFMINDCGNNQLIRIAQRDEDSDHPTQKPVRLMEYYIRNSTQPGQTVFDPFMGSGTTGVAAIKLGRKFIGIEKVEKYFDQACKRIEQALNPIGQMKDFFHG